MPIELTTAGMKDCEASGDFVSWKEAEWTLHSQAKVIEVDREWEGSCRRESQVQVLTGAANPKSVVSPLICPCIIYINIHVISRGILDTGASYCTKYTLCNVCTGAEVVEMDACRSNLISNAT